MADLIQFRRGTDAEWLACDPILAEGEPGYIEDTGCFVVGNGVDCYSLLDQVCPHNPPDPSIVTNVIAGNRIATHDDGSGNLVDIDETITTLVLNGNNLEYLNEAGVTSAIDLSVYIDDTNLAMIVSGAVNPAGIATFTRDDGSSFTIDFSQFFDDTQALSTITNIVAGNRIATHSDGVNAGIDIFETITGLALVGNGVYRYTNEAGNTFDFDTKISTTVVNPDGTTTITTDDGNSTIIEVPTQTIYSWDIASPGLFEDEWLTSAVPNDVVSNIFNQSPEGVCGLPGHINGAPDTNVVQVDWTVTSGGSGQPVRQARWYGWIHIEQDGTALRDTNANSGEYFRVFVDGNQVYENTTPTTGGAGSGISDLGTYSAGWHFLLVEMSDLSAAGGFNLQFDDGAGFANFRGDVSVDKPVLSCREEPFTYVVQANEYTCVPAPVPSCYTMVMPASSVDTFGTVTTATAPLTTTNGVDIIAGDFYALFPDGTTWSNPKCPAEMTRAQLIALRNANGLDPQCHYIITNPEANGTLLLEKVLVHALDAGTLSGCYLKTAHDNTAWNGSYDIDTDNVEYVHDHLRNNKVTTNAAIIIFPWGVTTVTSNEVDSGGRLIYTAGTFSENILNSGSTVTMTSGLFSNNEVSGNAVVINSGPRTINNEFKNLSNTTITNGDFRTNIVQGDATVAVDTTLDVDNNTFMALSNTVVRGAGTLDSSVVGTDANVLIEDATGATINILEASNLILRTGAVLSDSTVKGDSAVTLISGSHTENEFYGSVTISQLGTGRINQSTIGGNTTVTVGNVAFTGVDSFQTTINTTGATGIFYYSNLRNSSISLVNVPVVDIRYAGYQSFTSIAANNAARFYSRYDTADYFRYLVSAGASVTLTSNTLESYGYIQVLGGLVTMSYSNIAQNSYVYQAAGGDLNVITRLEVNNGSRIRFLNTANANQLYYSTVVNGSIMEYRGTSNLNRFYYNTVQDNSTSYFNNNTSGNIYYCTMTSSANVYMQANTGVCYFYYVSCTSNSVIYMQASTSRIYSASVTSQSILRVLNSTANIYYSSFTAYFYAYLTLSVTRTGLFGMGRNTKTITDPTTITPYATGASWLNF